MKQILLLIYNYLISFFLPKNKIKNINLNTSDAYIILPTTVYRSASENFEPDTIPQIVKSNPKKIPLVTVTESEYPPRIRRVENSGPINLNTKPIIHVKQVSREKHFDCVIDNIRRKKYLKKLKPIKIMSQNT